MNKVKQKELAENWEALVEGENFNRGKFLMEWINQKFSIEEICIAITKHTQCSISRGSVKGYIDKYGIAIGLGKSAGAPVLMDNAVLRKAVRAAGKEIEPEENDSYEEYYEKEGAIPEVAKRLAKAEKLGEWLKENEYWDDEKDQIKTKAIEEAEISAVERAKIKHNDWMKIRNRHFTNANGFIRFLQKISQDSPKMKEENTAEKLDKLVSDLEEEAERFRTGYGKYQGKREAKNRKVIK